MLCFLLQFAWVQLHNLLWELDTCHLLPPSDKIHCVNLNNALCRPRPAGGRGVGGGQLHGCRQAEARQRIPLPLLTSVPRSARRGWRGGWSPLPDAPPRPANALRRKRPGVCAGLCCRVQMPGHSCGGMAKGATAGVQSSLGAVPALSFLLRPVRSCRRPPFPVYFVVLYPLLTDVSGYWMTWPMAVR